MEGIIIRSAYFAIGYQCNHHCITCPCSATINRNQTLSTEDVISSIELAIKYTNIKSITLSGGEPTIQPHFFEVLDYLTHTNLNIEILTNSDKLCDENFVNRIVSVISSSRIGITTSLHSHIPKKHNNVTRTKGSFERSLRGLHNAINSGICVTIKHCITKLNYKEIDDFTDFIFADFTDNINFLLSSIDYCGVAADNKLDIAVSFDELGLFIERALDKVIEHRNNGRFRNVLVISTPLCIVDPYYWPFFSYQSKKNRSVYNSPLGDGNPSNLRFDLESDCGTFFPSCKICDIESICPGSWRSACELFSDVISPIKL